MKATPARALALLLGLGAAFAAPGTARAGDGDGDGDGEDSAVQHRGSDDEGVFERDAVEVVPADGVEITGVEIDNRFGDVRIEGHDGDSVIILAHKRAPDDETLDRVKVSLIPDPSGPIRITTQIASGTELRPLPSGAVRVDLVIRAPRNARVDARIWNGTLGLADMDNGANLDANEGEITVSNVSGPIVARNALGDQAFTSVFGALEAQGIDGDMELDTVRGARLEASVQHGSIMGTRIHAKHLELRTTIGDIKLAGEAVLGGTYRVSSAKGDIEVSFASKGALTVWAHTRSGTVTLPSKMKRTDKDGVVTASLGRGKKGPAIELRSRHGNIRFSLPDAPTRDE